jgi:hypothetical protein
LFPLRTERRYYLNMSEVDSAPPSEAEILAAAIAQLRDRLPSTWDLDTIALSHEGGDQGADAILRLRDPDGQEATLIVEIKNQVRGAADIARIRQQLDRVTARYPGSRGVLVTRYLSPAARSHLDEYGLLYLDLTGNLSVDAERPALFLRDRGADRDPWRGPGRPPAALKGEPAARVVRALADIRGPWRIRELIKVSRATTGSVYRVVDFLESEALVTRDTDSLVSVTDRAALLRRWSQDYQFLHTNKVTRWIAPRGLPALLDSMRKTGMDGYALTGSIAAGAWAPHAPARSAMIYATEPKKAATTWDLRPSEGGVNVLIARPTYPVVLERTREALDGLCVAAPSQVAVDMLTGPGRAPAEAEELLTWMGHDDSSWV